MAKVTATTFSQMMTEARGNILQLSQETGPQIDMKARLTTWKDTFFPLLDKSIPAEEKAHRWVVPTIALIQELGSRTTYGGNLQTFPELEEIIQVVARCIASVAFNGYTPSGATETAMLAVWNTAWT